MDSSNHFLVGVDGEGWVVVNRTLPRRLTRAAALNLAAWLQVIADANGGEVERLVREIKQL